MTSPNLQAILSQVEQPSRYLGCETNRIVKDAQAVRLHIALAFPDLYEIGTSHFGIQILYHILNQHPHIAAERVFAPADDFAAALAARQMPLMSLESRRPLNRFDIIGFSLLYELNYTNVLYMLKLAGIPWRAAEREANGPFVIAGGPCTFNPEPVADFFDALVIGDGETVILELARTWLEWQDQGGHHREDLLRAWSHLTGVYVPAFYTPHLNAQGCQVLTPQTGVPSRITKALIDDLNTAPFPDAPLVPLARPIHDRLRLEIARGCTRGCRFCQAGMIYRPLRERQPQQILDMAAATLAQTGYEDLSLLSLSTGDYGCIEYLLEQLMQRWQDQKIAVSLPSLRVGTLTPKLMTLIRQVRKTGFTLAPEAGSARLRALINKNITEEDMRATVENAFELGWQVIKLYFMIGLPTETESDLEEIVRLVRELRQIKNRRGDRKSRSQLNVSFTTFIPKSHTPLQWAAQLSLAESQDRLTWLQHELKLPGVQVKWQNPRVSLLEGLWARGDRRLAPLLEAAVNLGCRFDGWSDQFDFRSWQTALAQTGIEVDEIVTRPRGLDEPLPWDIVNPRITTDFLKDEYRRALNLETSADCRNGHCLECGICDFQTGYPRLADVPTTTDVPAPDISAGRLPVQNAAPLLYQITYQKREDARFLGHLEMVNLFLRALRRAKAPLRYSSGFHPKPKVSFDNPLPVGMESTQEFVYLTCDRPVDAARLPAILNQHLPDGLHITSCRQTFRIQRPVQQTIAYRVTGEPGWFEAGHLNRFGAATEWIVQRTSHKGRTISLNLKTAVSTLKLVGDRTLEMTLNNADGVLVRPQDVLHHVFEVPPEHIRQTRILKYHIQ